LPPASFEFHPGGPVSATATKLAMKQHRRQKANVKEQRWKISMPKLHYMNADRQHGDKH